LRLTRTGHAVTHERSALSFRTFCCGAFFPIAFENDAFRWVHGDISSSDIATEKAYLLSVGHPYAD